MVPLHIALIVGSTRTERFADLPLAWLVDQIGSRNDITPDVVDLRDTPLPFYDLPAPPAMAHRRYTSAAERHVGERLDAADGFIILTNEFNHGYSAALKNVLDHFFAEFLRKPVAFVGYGNVGGSRAIEQLRLVAAELGMVSVREAVHILGSQMSEIKKAPAPGSEAWSRLNRRLDQLLESLVWWARALRVAREEDRDETRTTLSMGRTDVPLR